MPEHECNVAVVGLGVMGANLARNFSNKGYRVAIYDRNIDAIRRLATAHPEADFVACESVEAMVRALARPRVIVVLVPAGNPVDEALDELAPFLQTDDVVVDAGNSLFHDTDRRSERAAQTPWRFVGMGISGGSEGALHGPSLMPGGDLEAWHRLRPLLESVAAHTESGPCVTHCGTKSAGHFVKMVHNGIEYGDMQLIAEAAVLLRRGLGLDASAVADVFSLWNTAELESYLIEISAEIFRTEDPQNRGSLLLDSILDRAGQKGTGRWTVKAALDLGVAIPTIGAAVDARVISANRERRLESDTAFGRSEDGRLTGVSTDDVRAALYASKVASYSQGFDLLACASTEHGYGTNLAEVARIWKAGCIIRARFLDRVREAFTLDDALASAPAPKQAEFPLLALTPTFRAELTERLPSWRRVVSASFRAGLPIPGLAASLAWFDSLTTARGSANLIQAQRDYFGSHTYERVDAPGQFVHTDWGQKGRDFDRS